MPNSLCRKVLAVGIIILFVGGSISSITGIEHKSTIQISSDCYMNIEDCVINITVYEAWDLLTNTSNGIQIPIDIRSDNQWNEGFIDTPYPENPVHLNENDTDFFDNFDKYEGKEIMIYCEGGYRSLVISYLLCNANFTGTIYNWGGGIIKWIEAGLPIRNNTAPEAPTVKGKVMIHEPGPYIYKFKAIDPENDYLRYFIDWGDGTWEWTDYNASGEEIIVSHTWNTAGTAMVISRANDTYGLLVPEGYLEWSKVDSKDIDKDCNCNIPSSRIHLTEKILNRLEKNKLFSNIINYDKTNDKFCNFLMNIGIKLEELYKQFPEGTIIYPILVLMMLQIILLWNKFCN